MSGCVAELKGAGRHRTTVLAFLFHFARLLLAEHHAIQVVAERSRQHVKQLGTTVKV